MLNGSCGDPFVVTIDERCSQLKRRKSATGSRSLRRLRWRVSKFRLIEFGKFLGPCGITLEALRLGSIVFLAPIAFRLEVVSGFRAAHAALFLWDAVFGAPPAAVVVGGLRDFGRATS